MPTGPLQPCLSEDVGDWGAGARVSGWAQMVRHYSSLFLAFLKGVEERDTVQRGRWKEAN